MRADFFTNEIKSFIRKNIEKNPGDIALSLANRKDWPHALIADQIKARQKAKKKLPDWYENDDLIMPPPVSIEQSTSNDVAETRFKHIQGDVFIDLTGGTGIDTIHLAKRFKRGIYVEKSLELCEIARHNFEVLGIDSVEVVNDLAEHFLLNQLVGVDFIFIDPSRRAEDGSRKQLLADGEPDIFKIQDDLHRLSTMCMLKASPMIDIQQTRREFKHICAVQIIESNGEVREINFSSERGYHEECIEWIQIKQSEILNEFKFNLGEEKKAKSSYSEPLYYLFDLSAGMRKSGAYKLVSERFEAHKLHPNSHLYTANANIDGFPGQAYIIKEVMPPSKVKSQINKANVIVRNFPMRPDEVKKKYSIKDGGDDFLFFTEIQNSGKVCIHAVRA